MIGTFLRTYFWAAVSVGLFVVMCGYCGSEGRGFRPVQNVREGMFDKPSVELARQDRAIANKFGNLVVSTEELLVASQRAELACGKRYSDAIEKFASMKAGGYVPATSRDLLAFGQTDLDFDSGRVVFVTGEIWTLTGSVQYYPSYVERRSYGAVTNDLRKLDISSAYELDTNGGHDVCLLSLRPAGGVVP